VGNQGESFFLSFLSFLPPSHFTSLSTLFLLCLNVAMLALLEYPPLFLRCLNGFHTILALLECVTLARLLKCGPHKSPILAYLASLERLQCSNCAHVSPPSTPSPSPETGTVPDVIPTTLPKRCEPPEKEWPLSKPLSPNSARGI